MKSNDCSVSYFVSNEKCNNCGNYKFKIDNDLNIICENCNEKLDIIIET